MSLRADTSAASALPVEGPVDSTVKKEGQPSTKKSKGGVVLECPGPESGSWQRWHFAPEGPPELLSQESPLPPQKRRILALPSSMLFAWPLWVANGGKSGDLVRLELSGRHLLKRGMEEALEVLPIASLGERQLVLAVAPEAPFPTDGMPADWKSAPRFEIPARLHGGAATSDLILWREWGRIQMAFYREGKVVWFSGIREEGLPGLVQRIALRLLAENIIERLPASVRIEGMAPDLTERIATALAQVFPSAEILRVLVSPAPWLGSERRMRRSRRKTASLSPPHLPGEDFDLPPSEARMERVRQKQRENILGITAVLALVYILLLIWGAGDFLIRRNALKKIRNEIAGVEAGALESKSASERWHTLRSAVDPSTYALDLLAAVATPTEGGKVRLTRFSLEQGRLQISGEATDVTQAYAFIEALKKDPLLAEYEWSSGQPQLAGKNSVRFDMEGSRPDTTHQTP